MKNRLSPDLEQTPFCQAIETVIAGAYTGTYSGTNVGYTQAGFELTQETNGELINQTDAYGESVIDFVHRGGSVYLMFESKVYKAGSTAPFYPWGSLGVMATAAAPIGRLASAVAASTVLTATAATPAAASPATLTGSKSILPPGSNLKLLFDSRCRNVPIRLLLLPSESGGNITWFTTT